MEIRELKVGDVVVLAPEGSLAATEDTSAIDKRLGASFKAGARRIVVDCASVPQLTSAAIRVLLVMSRKLARSEGRLVLCGMNAKVQRAFAMSGFDKDLTAVATREEALTRVAEPVVPPASRRRKASSEPPVADETAAPPDLEGARPKEGSGGLAAAILDAMGMRLTTISGAASSRPGMDRVAAVVLATLADEG